MKVLSKFDLCSNRQKLCSTGFIKSSLQVESKLRRRGMIWKTFKPRILNPKPWIWTLNPESESGCVFNDCLFLQPFECECNLGYSGDSCRLNTFFNLWYVKILNLWIKHVFYATCRPQYTCHGNLPRGNRSNYRVVYENIG